jgi:hypothetical protein
VQATRIEDEDRSYYERLRVWGEVFELPAQREELLDRMAREAKELSRLSVLETEGVQVQVQNEESASLVLVDSSMRLV